eukprot:gene17740-21152_t
MRREEERLLVVTTYRFYVFSSGGGKCVHDAHLLDLVEYAPVDGIASLKFRTSIVQFNSTQVKIDELAVAIKKMFSLNFPGMQADTLLNPKEDICWEIDNLFEANNLKDLNLSDWPEAPTALQGKALIEALKYNQWFESVVIYNNPGCLCNDWLATIGHEIQSLNLSKCSIGKQGLSLIFKTMRTNKWISKNIKFFSISGNKMEDCGGDLVAFLADALAMRHFEMSNVQLVWSSLRPPATITRSKETRPITRLDISQNKLVTGKSTQDPSADHLAAFLSLITPNLADIDLSSTCLAPASIYPVLSSAPNLVRLDLSDNELGEDGIVQLVETLCHTTLPKLKHLYINRNIAAQSSTDILSQTLSLTRVTASLRPNNNSASAANAIRALVQLIAPSSFALCPLETLHVAGNSAGRLRAEIIPLAQALLKNDTITELDISGHHAGDDLAINLGRVIQVNRTIKTLYWDENLTTTVGMEYFSIGFRRNPSLQHMPLPVLDIGELLKLPENSPAMQTIKERLRLADNSTTSTPPKQATTPVMISTQQQQQQETPTDSSSPKGDDLVEESL